MYGGNIRRWVKRGILLGGGVLLLGIAKRSTVWAEQKQQEVRTFGLYWEGESLPYRRDSRTFYLPLTEEMKETGVKKAGFADCNGETVSFVRLPETEELETAAAELIRSLFRRAELPVFWYLRTCPCFLWRKQERETGTIRR